jgi:antitoxin PrlF
MSESTLSSKGQVTVPKAIRMRLHLQPGDRLRFVVEADGAVRLAAATQDLAALRNILPRQKKRATLADIEATIKKRAARQARV